VTAHRRPTRVYRALDAVVEVIVGVLMVISLGTAVLYHYRSNAPDHDTLALAHLALGVAFAGWLGAGTATRSHRCTCHDHDEVRKTSDDAT
jgi:hypothetical protein